jgi:Ca-activated chloride channel family protein
MFAQSSDRRHQPMLLLPIQSLSVLASLWFFSTLAQADYTVLSGAPIAQGQMRVDDDLDQLQAKGPAATPCFTLEEPRVDAEISGVLARVRVSQVFKNPCPERL